MQFEEINLSIDKSDINQLTKYSAILQKKAQLRIKFKTTILYCKTKSLELLWQLTDLIPEENILFSYSIDEEGKEDQNAIKLKEIISLKEKANQIVLNSPEEAIIIYNDAISKIDNIEESNSKNKNDTKLKQFNSLIKEQKKLMISNKAVAYIKLKRYTNAIECDLMIITSLDHLFDKSYGRIISNYIELKQIDTAAHYVQEMKNIFPPDICDKYKPLFDRLKQEEEKANMRLKAIARNSQKNQKTLKDKLDNELQLKQKERKDEKNMSLLFNIGLFITSGLGLYLLNKYKYKFT